MTKSNGLFRFVPKETREKLEREMQGAFDQIYFKISVVSAEVFELELKLQQLLLGQEREGKTVDPPANLPG